jgi:hypothetical protein
MDGSLSRRRSIGKGSVVGYIRCAKDMNCLSLYTLHYRDTQTTRDKRMPTRYNGLYDTMEETASIHLFIVSSANLHSHSSVIVNDSYSHHTAYIYCIVYSEAIASPPEE